MRTHFTKPTPEKSHGEIFKGTVDNLCRLKALFLQKDPIKIVDKKRSRVKDDISPIIAAGKKYIMKTIIISTEHLEEAEMLHVNTVKDFMQVITEYGLMESERVYFSAGESKIKDTLIKKEPSFSAK